MHKSPCITADLASAPSSAPMPPVRRSFDALAGALAASAARAQKLDAASAALPEHAGLAAAASAERRRVGTLRAEVAAWEPPPLEGGFTVADDGALLTSAGAQTAEQFIAWVAQPPPRDLEALGIREPAPLLPGPTSTSGEILAALLAFGEPGTPADPCLGAMLLAKMMVASITGEWVGGEPLLMTLRHLLDVAAELHRRSVAVLIEALEDAGVCPESLSEETGVHVHLVAAGRSSPGDMREHLDAAIKEHAIRREAMLACAPEILGAPEPSFRRRSLRAAGIEAVKGTRGPPQAKGPARTKAGATAAAKTG